MNKNWSIVPLSQITKEITIKSSENNQFPAITSSLSGIYIQTDYFKKTVASANNIGYKIISPGQFTYRSMSDDGVFKINRYKFSHKGIVSPAYSVFEVINGDASFIEQFFDSHVFSSKLYKIIQGGTRLALKYKTLREIDLELPPIQEQKKIASILTSVDDLIENAQSQIKKFQDLKKSVINELLTKGIGHTDFKDSELGRIPKSWKITELSKVSMILSSNVDKKTIENETLVSLCNYMDVYKNLIITREINFMKASAKKSEINKFLIKKDDVIITKDSETPDDIAISSYVSEDFDNVLCGYHLSIIRSNKSVVDGKFLSLFFKLDYTRHRFSILANGTTRFGLNLKEIENSKILVPSLEEQKKNCKYYFFFR